MEQETDMSKAPKCPKCGAARILRFRTRDAHPFYGCLAWPRCDSVAFCSLHSDAVAKKHPTDSYRGFARVLPAGQLAKGDYPGLVTWVEPRSDRPGVFIGAFPDGPHEFLGTGLVVWRPQPDEALADFARIPLLDEHGRAVRVAGHEIEPSPSGDDRYFKTKAGKKSQTLYRAWCPNHPVANPPLLPAKKWYEAVQKIQAAEADLAHLQGIPSLIPDPNHPGLYRDPRGFLVNVEGAIVTPAEMDAARKRKDAIDNMTDIPNSAYRFEPGDFVLIGQEPAQYLRKSQAPSSCHVVRNSQGAEIPVYGPKPWWPSIGDLVHVGDSPVVFRVTYVDAGERKARLVNRRDEHDYGDVTFAAIEDCQPLVNSGGTLARAGDSYFLPFFGDRASEPELVNTNHTGNGDIAVAVADPHFIPYPEPAQETLMSDTPTKTTKKKTPKEQGSAIASAMGTGVAMAGTSKVGDIFIAIAKKAGKNSPLVLALLEDDLGREAVKFAVAIGLHTGAASTELLPGAEYIQKAALLQITYSTAKGSELAAGMFADEFAALVEIGKSIARSSNDEAGLPENASSVESLPSVERTLHRVPG